MVMLILILLVAFGIATATDIVSGEIPIWLFPGALALSLLWFLYSGNLPGYDNFIGAAALFMPILVLCLAGKMGGGDLIMFSVIGFILGLYELPAYMFWIGFVSLVVVVFVKGIHLMQHKKGRVMDKEMPIAPIAMAAYVLFMIRGYLCIQ